MRCPIWREAGTMRVEKFAMHLDICSGQNHGYFHQKTLTVSLLITHSLLLPSDYCVMVILKILLP